MKTDKTGERGHLWRSDQRMLKNRGALAGLAFFLGLGAFAVWQEVSTQHTPHNTDRNNASKNAEAHIDPRKPEERIADYTLWLERFTGLLAFVTLIQIGFLLRQIRLTRESIDLSREVSGRQEKEMRASIAEAAHAADAMDSVASGISENVINTRDMMETQRTFWRSQMRAYVFVQTGNILNVADPPNPIPKGEQPPPGARTFPDRGPVILMAIRNSGNTPANKVVHWNNAVIREFPLAALLPVREPMLPHLSSVFDVPPGGTITKNFVFPKPLDDTELARLRDGTSAIYVYGEIEYIDIFGLPHTTRYRYRHNAYTGVIGVSGELTGSEEGNDAT
jgi:hypothetical protein